MLYSTGEVQEGEKHGVLNNHPITVIIVELMSYLTILHFF